MNYKVTKFAFYRVYSLGNAMGTWVWKSQPGMGMLPTVGYPYPCHCLHTYISLSDVVTRCDNPPYHMGPAGSSILLNCAFSNGLAVIPATDMGVTDSFSYIICAYICRHLHIPISHTLFLL